MSTYIPQPELPEWAQRAVNQLWGIFWVFVVPSLLVLFVVGLVMAYSPAIAALGAGGVGAVLDVVHRLIEVIKK